MDENLQAIEEQLRKLQSEIDRLKRGDDESHIKSGDEYDIFSRESYAKHKDEFEAARDELVSVMKKITVDEGTKMFFAACFSVSSFQSEGSTGTSIGTGVGTTYFDTPDGIDEEALSAALEPLTNPRRVAILKELIKKPLTAGEIIKLTGLAGGQLYHHLSNLENAGLIEKDGDKYTAEKCAGHRLAGLVAACGGFKNAKKKIKDEKEKASEDEGEDPLLREAFKLAAEYGKVTAAMLQRRLAIGYGRAMKLIDKIEREIRM